MQTHRRIIIILASLLLCGAGAALVCLWQMKQTAATESPAAELTTDEPDIAADEEEEEYLQPVVVDIRLENGEPVLEYNGEPLTLAELKDFIRELTEEIEEQPVLFRAKDELTEQQWEDIIGSTMEDVPAFSNYGIEAPDRTHPYKEILLEDANTEAEANAHPEMVFTLRFEQGEVQIIEEDTELTPEAFVERVRDQAAQDARTRVLFRVPCDFPPNHLINILTACKESGLLNLDISEACDLNQ